MNYKRTGNVRSPPETGSARNDPIADIERIDILARCQAHMLFSWLLSNEWQMAVT